MRVTLGAAVVAGAILFSFTASGARTVKECDAEYSANKAAIKGAQKKADFIAACRAGTETVPGGAAAAPAPAAPAPAQTAAPAPAPAPMAPAAPPAPAPRATRTAPRVAPAAVGPNQFPSEAQAHSRCPGATIVWVNTKSDVYHFAGTKNYGNTKAGAYMCETDATAAGDRASKTETHP